MRRWRSLVWLAGSFLILILCFQFPRLNHGLHGFFDTITRPFFSLGAGIRDISTDVRYNFGRFWNAIAKEREYQSRILELEARLLRYDEMEKENRRLNKLLNFSQTLPFKTTGIRIIGEDNTPWKSVVLLDKGLKNNIRQEMVLVAPEGLAGRVLESSAYTSRAIFLTDPDSRVSAITSNGRVQGVVTGTGSENLQMKYLPLDSEVAIGEAVITSGIGSLFPKGLHIGKIESVERSPDGLHLLALVRPAVPFSRLEELLCIILPTSK